MKTFKLFFNSNQNSKSIDFMETAGVSSSYAPRWVEYVDEIGINDLNLEQIQFKAKDGTLYTISDFQKIIKNNTSESRSFTITQSPGGICKLRTPFNIRLAQWEMSWSEEPEINQRTNVFKANTGKILAIYKLLIDTNGQVKFKDVSAAGIEYEEGQVLALNDAIKQLKPEVGYLNLINTDNTPTGVYFDEAVMISGVPKADFALSYKGQEVYWISYKEGDYFKRDDTTGELVVSQKVPFQQYGEFKRLYKGEQEKDPKNIIPIAINTFCTNIVNQKTGPTFNVSGDKLKEFIDANEEKLSKINGITSIINHWRNRKVRESNVTKFHLIPSATYIVHNFYESNPEGPLSVFALKGIYGNDYEPGQEFGINNVNILLQTTVDQITLQEVLQHDEHLGYKINPGERGHILKNPSLPDASEYIPVLFMRHSSEDYFAFINTDTGKKEVLLGGRSFIYPKGKVPGNAININI
jgi:hypothetical protein